MTPDDLLNLRIVGHRFLADVIATPPPFDEDWKVVGGYDASPERDLAYRQYVAGKILEAVGAKVEG